MANSRVTPVLFRDVLANMLLFFALLVVVMLPFLHDPTKASDEPPPGLIQFVACWPDDMDVDVDVWAVAPGDEPVGFRRRDGKVWTLVRDDLGLKFGDTDNCEVALARSTPAGDYLVNVHAYSARPVEWPVTVQFTAIMRSNGYTATIRKGSVDLRRVGDERTTVAFTIDAGGKLIGSSVATFDRSIQR